MQQLQPGHTLQNGKFRIINVLGQGGFGITYRAHHTLLDREVCIKEFFFKTYCDRNEETHIISVVSESGRSMVDRFKQKFLKEARTLSALSHPNIVGVIDVFEENGTAYYVMDFIDGPTLSEIIKADGPLSPDEAVACIRQVGAALSHIHSRSINHLDVKPANIMRRNIDGAYILIDFGLAKQYDVTTGSQTSTTPVAISHGYAPIEQYKTGGVSVFSPQTDIYALGATLYYLLTGIVPLDATDLVDAAITFPPGIPTHLLRAITAAMQPNRSARPANVDAFCAMLVPPKPRIPRKPDSPRKPDNKKIIKIACGIIVALIVLGAGAYTMGKFVGKKSPHIEIKDEFDYGDDWEDIAPADYCDTDSCAAESVSVSDYDYCNYDSVWPVDSI